MRDRKQISLCKLVTSLIRHERTSTLEKLKNLTCLPDAPGYFSYAAEILLSVWSFDCLDSDIIALCLSAKTLWQKILSQAGGELEQFFAAAPGALSECSSWRFNSVIPTRRKVAPPCRRVSVCKPGTSAAVQRKATRADAEATSYTMLQKASREESDPVEERLMPVRGPQQVPPLCTAQT